MSATANSKPATSAAYTASLPPRSERELLAREKQAAKEAVAVAWQQLVAEVKRYPQEAADGHPWGTLLASASTGVLVGAGAAWCTRDRVECEARPTHTARHPKRKKQERAPRQEADGSAARHDPRDEEEKTKNGRLKHMAKEATKDAASSLVTSTLLQAAPAFIMGFLGAGAPQQGDPAAAL
ncbi:MAG: hypothetical protein H6816_07925 [Phycisphaerales bacterium]|nr:hypothetical protein [Phycisphaerales bacterium]